MVLRVQAHVSACTFDLLMNTGLRAGCGVRVQGGRAGVPRTAPRRPKARRRLRAKNRLSVHGLHVGLIQNLIVSATTMLSQQKIKFHTIHFWHIIWAHTPYSWKRQLRSHEVTSKETRNDVNICRHSRWRDPHSSIGMDESIMDHAHFVGVLYFNQSQSSYRRKDCWGTHSWDTFQRNILKYGLAQACIVQNHVVTKLGQTCRITRSHVVYLSQSQSSLKRKDCWSHFSETSLKIKIDLPKLATSTRSQAIKLSRSHVVN